VANVAASRKSAADLIPLPREGQLAVLSRDTATKVRADDVAASRKSAADYVSPPLDQIDWLRSHETQPP